MDPESGEIQSEDELYDDDTLNLFAENDSAISCTPPSSKQNVEKTENRKSDSVSPKKMHSNDEDRKSESVSPNKMHSNDQKKSQSMENPNWHPKEPISAQRTRIPFVSKPQTEESRDHRSFRVWQKEEDESENKKGRFEISEVSYRMVKSLKSREKATSPSEYKAQVRELGDRRSIRVWHKRKGDFEEKKFENPYDCYGFQKRMFRRERTRTPFESMPRVEKFVDCRSSVQVSPEWNDVSRHNKKRLENIDLYPKRYNSRNGNFPWSREEYRRRQESLRSERDCSCSEDFLPREFPSFRFHERSHPHDDRVIGEDAPVQPNVFPTHTLVFASTNQGYALTDGTKWHSNEIIYAENWCLDLFEAICFLTNGECCNKNRVRDTLPIPKVLVYASDDSSWRRLNEVISIYRSQFTCSFSMRMVEHDTRLQNLDHMNKAKLILEKIQTDIEDSSP